MLTSFIVSYHFLPGRYFDEISQDTGKYCFGVEDTLKALELGAVEILICWENLDIMRYVLKVPGAESSQPRILHLTPEQEKDKSHFTDKDVSSGISMRICTSSSHGSGDELFSLISVCAEWGGNGANGEPAFA
jgi:peptide subunit release factor 1 (eRF1)